MYRGRERNPWRRRGSLCEMGMGMVLILSACNGLAGLVLDTPVDLLYEDAQEPHEIMAQVV